MAGSHGKPGNRGGKPNRSEKFSPREQLPLPFANRNLLRSQLHFRADPNVLGLKHRGIVVELGRKPVARILYSIERKKNGERFWKINVDVMDYRRHGIATKLVRQLVNMARIHNHLLPEKKVAFLQAAIEADNAASISFFTQMGFIQTGNIRSGDYSEPPILLFEYRIPEK
ncbi:MAG: GNAT family N-acetyltransferase [Candidatus Diapherotrites archaeon]|nr:GNAT family N-acetyltransferase [Candidatus Diapherotrites archaeon]MDZ4256878.1 GNAT family N-acetyltransferase [archaeon]